MAKVVVMRACRPTKLKILHELNLSSWRPGTLDFEKRRKRCAS
jgi:hypothetical protein